jgi:Family of unknown function (DUF5317)
MLIGCALLIALATVPLRGGRIMALADVRFRAAWLAFAGIGLQIAIISVVPGGSQSLHRGLHLASYGFIGAFVVANRDIPYLWLMSLGGACNLAAIVANGGVMPASASALQAAGIRQSPAEFINSTSVPDAHLRFLGDIFAIPSWSPVSNVFSIGDVLLVAGALLAFHRICGSRPLRAPSASPAGRSPA